LSKTEYHNINFEIFQVHTQSQWVRFRFLTDKKNVGFAIIFLQWHRQYLPLIMRLFSVTMMGIDVLLLNIRRGNSTSVFSSALLSVF
jgi:hypothetical protein